MSIDCQWIEKNMEAFVCERLSPEESGLAHRHLEGCTQCRGKLDEMSSLDPLIRRFFRQELALAQAPKRPRWSVLAGVPAAAVTIIVAAILLRAPQPVGPPPILNQAPSPVAVSTETEPQAPAVPKVTNPVSQDRAKPQPISPDRIPPVKTTDATPSAATIDAKSDFLVTDPAGYSRTLKDYHGHILIFGVWSGKQPRTIASLERVYQTFGPNTKLRILGVANERQRKPAAATFPIVYNQGSMLLGANESEYLIVDGQGSVRARGSLLRDPNAVVASIRAALTRIN